MHGANGFFCSTNQHHLSFASSLSLSCLTSVGSVRSFFSRARFFLFGAIKQSSNVFWPDVLSRSLTPCAQQCRTTFRLRSARDGRKTILRRATQCWKSWIESERESRAARLLCVALRVKSLTRKTMPIFFSTLPMHSLPLSVFCMYMHVRRNRLHARDVHDRPFLPKTSDSFVHTRRALSASLPFVSLHSS